MYEGLVSDGECSMASGRNDRNAYVLVTNNVHHGSFECCFLLKAGSVMLHPISGTLSPEAAAAVRIHPKP